MIARVYLKDEPDRVFHADTLGPEGARMRGATGRWWRPGHRGAGEYISDQVHVEWAHRDIDRIEHEPASTNGATPTAPANIVADTLAQARVDLIALIDQGIPERERVPGCPMLIKGKRYLFPAGAGTGKSLAHLVNAVDITLAGGTVVIIDVENGSDEYARRLQTILADRPPEARQACQERLRYYAYPALSGSWSAKDWTTAVEGADAVVFDSSRNALTQIGLSEDRADEYATFVKALLMPLSRAGIATVVLDNTGHTEEGRARGSAAKSDLNEVTYILTRIGRFDLDNAGKVEFKLTRSRFPEQPAKLTMTLGGGTYGPLHIDEDDAPDEWRPTTNMARLIETAKKNPGIGRSDLIVLTQGKNEKLRDALVHALRDRHLEARQLGRKECIWWLRDLDGPTVPDRPGPSQDADRTQTVPVPVSKTGRRDGDHQDVNGHHPQQGLSLDALDQDHAERLLREHADVGGAQ